MLQELSEHIIYLPTQVELERPMLAYIRGSRRSLAVDAGFSIKHLAQFYGELDAAELPLPDVTALTHWHCDHSFALHAVHGITVAHRRTNEYLREHAAKCTEPGYREYMFTGEYFAKEYENGEPIVVKCADTDFTGELDIDLGGVNVTLFRTVSPHTDDTVCIFVHEDRVLFLGDAIYGDCDNDWRIDPERMRGLMDTIERCNCDLCVPSHAHAHPKQAMLRYLQRKLK